MDYHHKTKEWFLEAVRLNPRANQNLKDKIVHSGHPRLQTFLDNLDREIKQAQAMLLRKGKTVKPETIKGFVYDLTDTFLNNLEMQARQMYESDNARLAREAKLQEHKDMESTIAGKPSGIFEEAGVLVDEKTRQDETL